MSIGYDPVRVADALEPLVAPRGRGGVQLRRYYRFRCDRWYGGIVTGDVVGCNLRCGFCWAYRFAWRAGGGTLLSPGEAAERLLRLARRCRVRLARLSGGEPTIGFHHLASLIEEVTGNGLGFVVETNGLLLGAREEYAWRLGGFHGSGVEVRVSVKGCSPGEFHRLTGAQPGAWWLQLRALELLVAAGLEPGEEVYPALMLSFTGEEECLARVKPLLKRIHPRLAESIDPEYVILYPHVERLMKMRGLQPVKAYRPGELPEELV